MPPVSRGVFLTFEGIEGSGKTTQAARLAEALRFAGRAVTLIREPGGTPLAEAVRRLLLAPGGEAPEPLAEAFLFQAARADLVAKVIEPALARGGVVIADRYADASVAYQGLARGLGRECIEHLNALATGGRTPDRTYLMDLDIEASLARVQTRVARGSAAETVTQGGPGLGNPAELAEMTRLDAEPASFHRRVRAAYLELAAAHPGRFRVRDATRSADDLAVELWHDVQDLVGVSR